MEGRELGALLKTCGSLIVGEKGQFLCREASAGSLILAFDGLLHGKGAGLLATVELVKWRVGSGW